MLKKDYVGILILNKVVYYDVCIYGNDRLVVLFEIKCFFFFVVIGIRYLCVCWGE